MKLSRDILKGNDSQGLTLVELVVVMVMICLMALILVPVIGSVEEDVGKAQCANNLKMIYVAVMMYAQDNGGYAPIFQQPDSKGGYGYWLHTPATHPEPYFAGVYLPVRPAEGGKHSFKGTALRCPILDEHPDPNHEPINQPENPTYAPVLDIWGVASGLWPNISATPLDKVMSPEKKILMFEGYGAQWYERVKNELPDGKRDAYIAYPHPEQQTGTNVLWCDGHISYVKRGELTADMFNPKSDGAVQIINESSKKTDRVAGFDSMCREWLNSHFGLEFDAAVAKIQSLSRQYTLSKSDEESFIKKIQAKRLEFEKFIARKALGDETTYQSAYKKGEMLTAECNEILAEVRLFIIDSGFQ